MITRDEARRLFSERGFDYSVLSPQNLDLLCDLIEERIDEHNDEHPELDLRLHHYTHGRWSEHRRKGKIVWVEITVDGAYFRKREAITFNDDGFIGFCGWAADCNTAPFTLAFSDWLGMVEPITHTDNEE